ncbi:MAG: SDR family NAD(P)-dependent oxidoreductase [Pseudomonadota bacterium]
MTDLNRRVAIVTGAGSGIGASLARLLSEAGALVCLAARRRDRLMEAAESCPHETLVFPADLTAPDDREALVKAVFNRWKRIDILVNNAGLGGYGPFLETSGDEWRKLFEINVFAPVFLTGLVLPIMLSQGAGLIVNLASIGGLIAHSDKVTPYVASKHALVGFSRGLAKDLAGTGVRVLAACPHLTDTEFFTTSPGSEEMAPVVEKYRGFMDTAAQVARGIVDQLDSEQLIIFPTEKPRKAYLAHKDF